VSVKPRVAAAVEAARQQVCALLADLVRYGLVVWTAGNVSAGSAGPRRTAT
jgi:L-ribulose-5-phosphate 4-epimerase